MTPLPIEATGGTIYYENMGNILFSHIYEITKEKTKVNFQWSTPTIFEAGDRV